jgi:glycosyltransferase 2 family protein
MKNRGDQILLILRIFGILLGISLLVYQIFLLLRDFNWFILSLKDLINVFLTFGINILAVVSIMTAWKLILGEMGRNISLINIYSGFNLSLVARYIPGTIWGYLSRGEWLKREHNVPYAMTHFCSIIETIGIIFASIFVVMQGLFTTRETLFSLLLFIIFLIGSWASLNWLILWKPTRRLFRLEDNFVFQFPLLKWIVIFILFTVMWYGFGFGLMVFARIIDFQITFPHFLEISSVYALAWFIGFIVPFVPSGLGLREYSLTILLVSQFGLAKSDASFIAIGFRVLVSMAELIWILFGLSKKTLTRLIK